MSANKEVVEYFHTRIPLGFANPVGMITTIFAFGITENAFIDRIERKETEFFSIQNNRKKRIW